MARTPGQAVVPQLLSAAGVAVVVGLMSHLLLGPGSPLRMGTTAGGGLHDVYATILTLGVPVLVLVGIALWLWAQSGGR